MKIGDRVEFVHDRNVKGIVVDKDKTGGVILVELENGNRFNSFVENWKKIK